MIVNRERVDLHDLEELVSTTRKNLEDGYYREGSHDFSLQSFTKSIRKKGGNPVVAELKLTSYSDEAIVTEDEVEPVLQGFASGGARAISILPEPHIYKGRLEHISMAKRTGLPVLVSDFIIDPSQMICARSWGGDAVFLLYSFFRSKYASLSLEDMMETARGYGLEVVLEVGTFADFMAAVKSDADAIGINNLDFATGEVDINRTMNILTEAEAVLSEGIRDKPIVTMEGIQSKAEIDKLRRAGATAFLVGTSLFREKTPEEKLKELI
jgi:indole-3-glycerol phosphate synthase